MHRDGYTVEREVASSREASASSQQKSVRRPEEHAECAERMNWRSPRASDGNDLPRAAATGRRGAGKAAGQRIFLFRPPIAAAAARRSSCPSARPSSLAQRLRSADGAPLGEVFSF